MADDDVLGLLGQINSAVAEPPLSLAEKVMGYSRSVLAGPTFNFADNIEAAIASPFTDKTYGQELEGIRSEQDRFKRNTDYLDNAVEIASGAVLNPLNKVKELATGAKYGANFLSTLFTNPASQAAISAVGADNGEDPLRAAATGGVIGTGGAILANKLGTVLGNAGREADRLKTSAYGITATDINKQLKKMGSAVDQLNSADSIPLVRSIEKFENAGVINAGNDVVDNVKNLYKVQNDIGGKLGSILKDADSVIPANPDFQLDNTLAYIDALSGTAKTKASEAAFKEVSALADQLGTGSLQDLQKLKTGLNYKFDDNPYTDDIIKAIRSDLRQEIEKRVDAAAAKGLVDPKTMPGVVKYLNKEWGEAAELKDLLIKKAGKDFGGDIVDDTLLSGSTTGKGATGTLNVAGAVTGNPIYWGASALLQGAKVPLAKSKIADFLREADQTKLSNVGKFLENYGTARNVEQGLEATKEPKPYQGDIDSIEGLLGQINALTTDEAQQNNQSTTKLQNSAVSDSSISEMTGDQRVTSLLKPTSSQPKNEYSFVNTMFKGDKMDKVPVAIMEEIKQSPIDEAVMLAESNGNPKAKNENSSASGLFQLVSKTAKSLGVKDVFDPADNYAGYKKLRDENIDRFGDDPIAIYSAHYLGAPVLAKVLAGKSLTDNEAAQVKYLKEKALPRFLKIYNDLIKNKETIEA